MTEVGDGSAARDGSGAGDVDEEARASVWLMPYLPISDDRFTVGDWELIATNAITDADVVAAFFDLVQGLFKMYESPDGLLPHGYYLKMASGKVGEPVGSRSPESLRRSVLAALLDGNPTDRDVPNAGHLATTSDNAVLWGHVLNLSGDVAVRYGFMVTAIVGGLRVGPDRIQAPLELHLPLFAPRFDTLYARELYKALTDGSDKAASLSQAIEWLDIAWRNSVSISQTVRITALKSGFEALLDADEKVWNQRAALSRLLQDATPKRVRNYTTREGKAKAEEMTDLEWWYTQFAFLRNEIAHGNVVDRANFDFDGEPHMWIAERRLREAIKRTVVEMTGNQVILQDRLGRLLRETFAPNLEEENPTPA